MELENIGTVDSEELIKNMGVVELINLEFPNPEDNIILLKRVCKLLYDRLVVLEEQHTKLENKTVRKR